MFERIILHIATFPKNRTVLNQTKVLPLSKDNGRTSDFELHFKGRSFLCFASNARREESLSPELPLLDLHCDFNMDALCSLLYI